MTNRASIRSDEADLNRGNDTATAELTIKLQSTPPPPPAANRIDVAVTVRPPSGLATVGVPGAWTVRVVNNGPATATNVTLTTTPHGKADVVDATVGPDACFTSPAIRCGLGTLAPGASRTVSVNLRPTAAGRLELAGRVSSAEDDRAPANNTDQAAVTVGLADVEITATATRPELISGTATTVAVKAVTRSRRPARNASVCVQAPHSLNIPRPHSSKLRRGSVCWPIARLVRGHRRVFRLHAVAPRVSRPRTIVLGITVRGAGVRRRHARLALRIDPRPKPPPAPSPVVTG